MKSRFLTIFASCLLWVGFAFAQVNINTASLQELDSLKGIGPTKAKAIVDYRRKNGPFNSVDELQNVPGIGPATLHDLRADVTVGHGGAAPKALPKPAAAPAPMAQPRGDGEHRPAVGQPAAPARPALPAPAAAERKPAAPAVPLAKPAAPAQPAKPAFPMLKPADHADVPATRPAAPAMPARPAQPVHPAPGN